MPRRRPKRATARCQSRAARNRSKISARAPASRARSTHSRGSPSAPATAPIGSEDRRQARSPCRPSAPAPRPRAWCRRPPAYRGRRRARPTSRTSSPHAFMPTLSAICRSRQLFRHFVRGLHCLTEPFLLQLGEVATGFHCGELLIDELQHVGVVLAHCDTEISLEVLDAFDEPEFAVLLVHHRHHGS